MSDLSPRTNICPSLNAGEAKIFSSNLLCASISYFSPGFTKPFP